MCPPNLDITIWTDAESVITAVKKFKSLKHGDKHKLEYRWLIAAICDAIEQRKLYHNCHTSLQWVPAHMDECEDKPEGKQKKARDRIDKIEEEYPGFSDIILEGNERADFLAKQGRAEHHTADLINPDPWVVRDEKRTPLQGNIRKRAKSTLQAERDKCWIQTINKRKPFKIAKWEDIDPTARSALVKRALKGKNHKKKRRLDATLKFHIRTLGNRLPTANEMCRRGTSNTMDPTLTRKIRANYKDHFCHKCAGQKENLPHILTKCPEAKEYKCETLASIASIFKEYAKKIPKIGGMLEGTGIAYHHNFNSTPELNSISEEEKYLNHLVIITKTTAAKITDDIEKGANKRRIIEEIAIDLAKMKLERWKDSRHSRFGTLA